MTALSDLIAELNFERVMFAEFKALMGEENDRLRSMNAKLRIEIELLQKPQLNTRAPIFIHPNHLRDPDVGPIIQAKIQAGLALLSQPMCTECADLETYERTMQSLLNKVNVVTAMWRHGKRVGENAMAELCNRQIEVEDALKKLE